MPKTDDGEIEIYSMEEMSALLAQADVTWLRFFEPGNELVWGTCERTQTT